jgi:hypothetical protein
MVWLKISIETLLYRWKYPPGNQCKKKNLISKSVMTKTVKQAHELYLQQNTSRKMSLSAFRKLRPKTVLTANKTQLPQCLCEYCTNIELKLNALKRMGVGKQYKNVYDVHIDSLYPKVGKHYDINCIDRKCENCGTAKLKSKLILNVNKPTLHGRDGRIQPFPLETKLPK